MRRREFLSAFYQATIVNEPSAENTGVDFLPLTSLIKKHKNCKGAPVRCTKEVILNTSDVEQKAETVTAMIFESCWR
ncbi:hypothetical protein NDU88_003909 [Pleurodeles waltl]|uniref:Uncharacterized protein n=1 Tax=Pleurodeles waltl TaxID=8319 RepID=A0AAV7T673_PLEWA|nr:hypothetical protein NDU88_003909 [Pleurodeles waltl]